MTILVRFLRDRIKGGIWWGVVAAVLVLTTVAFFPSLEGDENLEKTIQDLPEGLRGLFGLDEGASITSPPGYLHARLFSSLLPVLLIAYGVNLGVRAVAGSEDDGTLELLLSSPRSRRAIATARFGGAVAALAALALGAGAVLLATAPAVGLLDGLSVGRLVIAVVAAFFLGLTHLAIAFGVGAATGRPSLAMGVAAAVAGAGFLLNGLGAVSDPADAVAVISPWRWAIGENLLVKDPGVAAILAPLVVSAVVASAGVALFARRDTRV